MPSSETGPDNDGATRPSDAGWPTGMRPPRLPVSAEVGGWRIEAHVGSGLWSDVYVGAGTLDGVPRRLALKAVQVADLPEAREAALREAHALSSFRHRHLMRALAVWQEPRDSDLAGAVVFLMPLAELSLADYIRGLAAGQYGSRNLPAICAGAAGIADALGYLHSSRKADGSGVVVHNDVKPGNVFQVDGQWLLGDLGIASPPGRDSASAHAGSLSYLAPEYLSDPPAGRLPPGDVWAFGVTLHRWLTGDFPFPGDTPSERADAVRAGVQPALTVTDPALRDLVSAMLDWRAPARPSAAAVAHKLRAAVGLPRRRPRVRATTMISGAALVIVGGFGGALGYASLSPPQQPTTLLRFASYGKAQSVTHGLPVPIHAQPQMKSSVVGRLPDGAPAGVVCTGHGDAVVGNWGSTSLWDRISYGHTVGWVSDGLLFTGTNAAVAPACHGG